MIYKIKTKLFRFFKIIKYSLSDDLTDEEISDLDHSFWDDDIELMDDDDI